MHPDKNQDQDTSERFQAVQRAYEFLNNPDNKSSYDSFLITQKEKEKRLAAASNKVRQFRQELLKREKEAQVKVNLPPNVYVRTQRERDEDRTFEFVGNSVIKIK